MSIRDRRLRSRWTGRVGSKSRSKSASQDDQNLVERGECADFEVKRPVKHFVPIRGVHAAAAHLIQQLYANPKQIKYIFLNFFLSHVVN